MYTGAGQYIFSQPCDWFNKFDPDVTSRGYKEVSIEMGIVFLWTNNIFENEQHFWERTIIFVNYGVVKKEIEGLNLEKYKKR